MSPKVLLAGATMWLGSLAASFFLGTELVKKETGHAKNPSLDLSTSEDPSGRANNDHNRAAVEGPEAALDANAHGLEMGDEAQVAAETTIELLEQAFAIPSDDFRRNRIIRDLLEELAEDDPLEALRLADQLGSLGAIEDARTEILEVWSAYDPVAALAWATEAMQNEPMRSREEHLLAVYTGFATKNPQAAFTSALSLSQETSSDRRIRTRVLAEIVSEQVENGGLSDARLAVELLDEGPSKDRLISELVEEWAEYDPKSASIYVESLAGGASSEIKTALLGEWAESDPAGAAAWLSAQAVDEAVLGRAGTAIIREWTRYDMAAPAEWLNSLPESPALDRAVMSYTYRASQEDPANAMTWAVSINNDWMRNRMMEQVASTWKVDDPAAFQLFLNGAELSDEEKARLQDPREFHGGHR